MTDELRSFLPSAMLLGVLATIALFLTLSRPSIDPSPTRLRGAVRVALLMIVLQAAHFAEEYATGLHVRLPELLGLAPWPVSVFVSFNLSWLGIWIVSAAGLAVRRHAALFPLWFLGLAGAVNVAAHPLLAAAAGGYFPGLVTSPLVGVGGVWLLRRLDRVTAGERAA